MKKNSVIGYDEWCMGLPWKTMLSEIKWVKREERRKRGNLSILSNICNAASACSTLLLELHEQRILFGIKVTNFTNLHAYTHTTEKVRTYATSNIHKHNHSLSLFPIPFLITRALHFFLGQLLHYHFWLWKKSLSVNKAIQSDQLRPVLSQSLCSAFYWDPGESLSEELPEILDTFCSWTLFILCHAGERRMRGGFMYRRCMKVRLISEVKRNWYLKWKYVGIDGSKNVPKVLVQDKETWWCW